jgi:TruD family tRNA pseudouridine synthase
MLLQQSPDIDQEKIAKKNKIVDLVFNYYDIEEALSMLDRRDRLERAILQVLKKGHNQYYNAFQNISRNTRFIYVHGYQSFVWNKAVSERLRRFGRKVLIGDLAIKRECAHLVDNENIDEVVDDEEAAADGEKSLHP